MSKVDPNNVSEEMCDSCPFRPGSKLARLAPHLALSAITQGNRVCHSTGSSGIYGRTKKPARICRGARNVQLRHYHAAGVLTEPTDACWKRTLGAMRAKRK